MIVIDKVDKSSLDKKRLASLVKSFESVSLTVFGDLILDEYLLGNPSRISREAPVIILKYLNSSFALGGSANAANNAASLGAQVTLIGTLGDDIYKTEFEKLCQASNITLKAVIDKHKATTTKTRVISTSNKDSAAGTGIKQQVLRIDREFSEDLDLETFQEAKKHFVDACKETDIILLSDYSNGNLNQKYAKELLKITKDMQLKTIIDSTGDLEKFKGAYSFTPNQPDLEKYLGVNIKSDQELFDYAQQAKQKLNAEKLLLTRGAKGMALIEDKNICLIPAFNLSEVFDVTGAGDTVAALYCLSLASGASDTEAAIIGNLGASLVVKKAGTATVKQEELLDLIERI